MRIAIYSLLRAVVVFGKASDVAVPSAAPLWAFTIPPPSVSICSSRNLSFSWQTANLAPLRQDATMDAYPAAAVRQFGRHDEFQREATSSLGQGLAEEELQGRHAEDRGVGDERARAPLHGPAAVL